MKNPYIIALSTATLLATAMPASAVVMVSGGVGDKSEERVENVEENFNLKVVFTGEGGMYLSDVKVKIQDTKGQEVATGITQGPFLLAELEPGSYTVFGSKDGFERKRVVKVGSELKTYHITFPLKDEPKNTQSLNNETPVKMPKMKQSESYTVGARLQ